MGDAATPVLPVFTTQGASAYKGNIDAGFAVADRIAWPFAPHEQSTPDMTVRVDAGAIFDDTALTAVVAQSTGAITAPSTNPRIDRVVINRASGTVSVITGAEAPSPSPPAITGNVAPIAQVALVVSQVSILNSDITDERVLALLGLGSLATDDINGLTEDTSPDLGADFIASHDTSASAVKKILLNKVGGFDAGTKIAFQQTAAPTGWTKETTHDNKALRLVTGTAGSAGATGFTSVFGASKVTGAHTLVESEMPAHVHGIGGASTMQSGSSNFRLSPTVGSIGNTKSTGGGGSHDHTLSLDLQYVDFIIASKD